VEKGDDFKPQYEFKVFYSEENGCYLCEAFLGQTFLRSYTTRGDTDYAALREMANQLEDESKS